MGFQGTPEPQKRHSCHLANPCDGWWACGRVQPHRLCTLNLFAWNIESPAGHRDHRGCVYHWWNLALPGMLQSAEPKPLPGRQTGKMACHPTIAGTAAWSKRVRLQQGLFGGTILHRRTLPNDSKATSPHWSEHTHPVQQVRGLLPGPLWLLCVTLP
jgi:hypothetical protein